MAVLTKEEFINSIKQRIGEDTSDETIKFIEDTTDTINDLDARAKGDGVDWKKKYEDNDAEWRKKYTERFFDPEADKNNPINQTKNHTETEAPKTFEELFTVEGGK